MPRKTRKINQKIAFKVKKSVKVHGSLNSGYGNNSNSQDYYAINTRGI